MMASEPDEKSNAQTGKDGSKPQKNKEFFKKKCALCDELITGESEREVSSFMSQHLEKIHPVVDEPDKEIQKKTFKAKCETCERIVESDTKEGLDSLMQTHSMSHDRETEIESHERTKDNSVMILAVIGVSILLIGASIALYAIFAKSKKTDLSKSEKK